MSNTITEQQVREWVLAQAARLGEGGKFTVYNNDPVFTSGDNITFLAEAKGHQYRYAPSCEEAIALALAEVKTPAQKAHALRNEAQAKLAEAMEIEAKLEGAL